MPTLETGLSHEFQMCLSSYLLRICTVILPMASTNSAYPKFDSPSSIVFTLFLLCLLSQWIVHALTHVVESQICKWPLLLLLSYQIFLQLAEPPALSQVVVKSMNTTYLLFIKSIYISLIPLMFLWSICFIVSDILLSIQSTLHAISRVIIKNANLTHFTTQNNILMEEYTWLFRWHFYFLSWYTRVIWVSISRAIRLHGILETVNLSLASRALYIASAS